MALRLWQDQPGSITGEYEQKDIYEGEDIMQKEESEKYLGDIVTNDGKNEKNIKARLNKIRGMTFLQLLWKC